MSDLVEFLSARIAEDEAVARTAGEPPWDEWRYDDGGEVYHAETRRRAPNMRYPNGVTNDTEGLSPAVTEDVGPHIARHDPARVLAECRAKRRIVEAFADAERAVATYDHDNPIPAYWQEWGNRHALASVLESLAQPYADHADYDPAWAM